MQLQTSPSQLPGPPSRDPPVLFIVGPTAIGKSDLSMRIAPAFGGEIVSADSRQVYRYMDIGTAKPSPGDEAQVHHHLINIIDPDQEFSMAMFLDLARRTIQDIHSRDKIPVVVGGTGQYIWALAEGWQVPQAPPLPELRRRLEDTARREGSEALYRRLTDIDPDTASSIDPRNVRRVVRALEIYHSTGQLPSVLRRKRPPAFRSLVIGLTTSREALYSRIDLRVDGMLERGLVSEVRDLLGTGYSPDLPCMSSMGYKEIALYLNGGCTLEEAQERIKFETHRFARHQYAWFRLKDPRIHWLEAEPDMYPQAEALIGRFLNERP